ncbi:RAB15 protein, partial [Polypterus senegalus]
MRQVTPQHHTSSDGMEQCEVFYGVPFLPPSLSKCGLQNEDARSGWDQSKNSDLGIFLVYDITSERSFKHIMKWASDVDEYAPEKVQKILIGNKADEDMRRQVATDQGVKVKYF